LVRNVVGGGWKSLDFEWMLRNKDSKHFGNPDDHPLTMYESLLYGRDGETLDQRAGCSGVTYGGSLPTTNPFIRIGTFCSTFKAVDNVEHCVARSVLLLRMVEDADIAVVGTWEPRVSLTPFEDQQGTLFGALKTFNERMETYYIQTQKVMQLVDKNVYNDRVARIQREGLFGLVEVAVRDTESDSGYRTNHVMAVVNGVLVDPSDGSTHPWPVRTTKPDDAHWLRDVTMFVPMKKVPKGAKKARIDSRTRRKRKDSQSTSSTTTVPKAEKNDNKRRMTETDVIIADLETLATKAKDLDSRTMSQAHQDAIATGMAKLRVKIESVCM